ncbi:MAG TPA: IS21 family transposase [Clostridia bacterium]|nr:IS21 family transposase [Clostridia bacterium]
MVNYREILRLRSLGYSQRQVAASVHSSRRTISEVYELADTNGLSWPLPSDITNTDVRDILYPERAVESGRKMPDCSYLHKELAKPGVTLTLLWSEYCEKCHIEGLIPYQYTQFCEHYRAFASKTKATMRIKRKPGELLEVDWAGSTLVVVDEITGEIIPAYVFVAALPCSLYGYAEAFPSMKMENWINAHIHMYQFFGGATRIVVPDNLKVGVIKHTRNEIVLNKVYQEMAEHYGTAIIPARPVSPKDKPSVEGTVGVISTWVIAALRNEKFFSFSELNDAVKVKIKEFNSKPFQKKRGSRLSAFEEEEKPFLLPLPTSPYEMAVWSTATIQSDYLITVGKCKYSIPYEFIGHTVDIRYTSKTIEVFFQNNRIASHVRMYGICDPQILPEHMPDNHRKYLAWNKETFLDWAETVGPSTSIVMKALLASHKVEKLSYKSCGALMKLAGRYSVARIEEACGRALSYTPNPNLKNIQMILKTGQDKVKPEKETTKSQPSGRYGFTRGAEYFGGGHND